MSDPQPQDSHQNGADDGGHGDGHHHVPFSFQALLDHHNSDWPAVEWFHDKPILIFDLDAYTARKNKYSEPHGIHHDAGHWQEASMLGVAPSWLSWMNNQTFFGTMALSLMAIFLLVVGRRRAAAVLPIGRIQNLMEGLVQFVRDDIVRPNIHHGDRWTAHIAAIFLAILSMNLMGLVPIGGTGSGNPGVTAGFALTTLLTMLIFGMKEQGVFAFWKNLVPIPFTWAMSPVWVLLAIIELMSLIIKPVALAIRLFANMFAGHTVLYAFLVLGYIVSAAGQGAGLTLGLGAIGFFMGIAIFALELLVALIQAYVFTLLSAVFIGASIHPEH